MLVFANSSDVFQFTHPGKGATALRLRLARRWRVSIHAPWEGCDNVAYVGGIDKSGFQFTHPGKGATQATIRGSSGYLSFNSRTLGRVRRRARTLWRAGISFNSRTLGRVRQLRPQLLLGRARVSIHAPWEGCDLR